MTTTITHTAGTITPVALEGYRASRPARTLVHRILNREDDDVTLREFGRRAGSLRLVFHSEASAFAALDVLSDPQTLALANSDVPSLNMSFVIAEGDLDIEQDDDDANLWRVIVPFREVTV